MKPGLGISSVPATGFDRLARDGFQIIEKLVSPGLCDVLAEELTPLLQAEVEKSRNRVAGLRNLLRTNSKVSDFSRSEFILDLIQKAAGEKAFPVRAIFFDKNPAANWLVPWHQDLAIAVTEQMDAPGFTGWSRKDGVVHVHPPEFILAGMITLRVHLDDCGPDNGALKVIAGSHQEGKLSAEAMTQWTAGREAVICAVPKGGALLLRPLLLHASEPAVHPNRRRVLHIEFATHRLPGSLTWYDNPSPARHG